MRAVSLWQAGTMLAAVLASSSALAQGEGERALCPDRPGLGTPACTLEEGAVVAEIGLADWTRDDSGPVRSDSVAAGEALLRFGLTPSIEAQIGWTAFGHVRVRDRALGTTSSESGVGDITLALRQNFQNPDGSGFSIAAMPYASLPVGGATIGAGDWGAGLLLPMSLEAQGLSFSLTPQIAAAVDSDGDGRHLAYGGVAGVGFGLSEAISATIELSALRDRDPSGHATELLAGLSAGWQPDAGSQWDAGANLGLNRSSPDLQLYFGYARRF